MPPDAGDDARDKKQAFFKAQRRFVLLSALRGPLHDAIKEAIIVSVNGRYPISLSMSVPSLTRTEANLISPFKPLGLYLS